MTHASNADRQYGSELIDAVNRLHINNVPECSDPAILQGKLKQLQAVRHNIIGDDGIGGEINRQMRVVEARLKELGAV